MNKGHISEGEIVNLEELREDLDVSNTHALARTDSMEVIRIVIPKGKSIREHHVGGEIQVQCLKGNVQFSFDRKARTLKKGDWLFLGKGVSHSLKAEEDTVILLTILFDNQKEP
jgi:quercetin dioxygenase-like cupin family protein